MLGTWLSSLDGRSRLAVIGLCFYFVETPVDAVCVYYLDPENFRRVFKVTFEVLADVFASRKDLVYLWF